MDDNGRPLNLMVVTNDLLVGGVQRNIVRYFEHFDKRRFKLHLATVCEAGPLAQEVALTGAEVFSVRSIAGIGPLKTITPWGVWRLAKIMREKQIDVVQTRLFLGNTIGRLAAVLAGVPVIVAAEHSTYFDKTIFHRRIDRLLIGKTERIVAVSQAVAEFTSRQEMIAPDLFTVVYNGLDLENFKVSAGKRIRQELGIAPDAPVLGSVARLIEEKGFTDFVSLLPQIVKKEPKVVFLLVGDGPERVAIQKVAQQAQVADRVVFTGERNDVPELLSAMDLFVLPSRREGLPTAVLEAMATGICVLTNDLPQFKEIVTDGKDGRIVDFADRKRVAETIVKLLADGDRRRTLAAAGNRRAQDFSVKRMVDSYADLYLQLWEARKSGPALSSGRAKKEK